jgi:tRNA nucleotidyltransferase (CCA-adding enzyme)
LQLLGSDSHDIDVALENMTGHAFALQFTKFARKIKDLPVKSVAVVKGNPGQSKHLETAKTTVLGLDLDFVNLRDEAYADDSRIPTNIVRYLRDGPFSVYSNRL